MKERISIWYVRQLLLAGRGNNLIQPASRIKCNIAFGELVVNFSDSHISNCIDTVVPVLVEMLRDIPFLRFDKTLSWDGAAHLVYLGLLELTYFINRLGSPRPTCLLDYVCFTESFQPTSKLCRSSNISYIRICFADN